MNAASLPFVNLRAMEPEDLEMLYRIENMPDVWGVSNTNVPYSRYVLHEYIARASNDIYADGQVRFVIEDERADVVGLIDVVNFDPQHRRAELSVVVRRDCRRRGYASAAVSRVKDYALRVLHLHQLYAIVASGNGASMRLFGSMGFQSAGVLADWLYDGVDYSDACLMQCRLGK